MTSRRILLATILVFYSLIFLFSNTAFAAEERVPTIAVIFTGSIEFQQNDYYEIAMEAFLQRFPAEKFKLFIGDYSQMLFERYSDKQGLIPGQAPVEEKMTDFAWKHSFDQVLFLHLSAPVVTTPEVTVILEKAKVSINARVAFINARQRKIITVAETSQTADTYTRTIAKKIAFKKCLEYFKSTL